MQNRIPFSGKLLLVFIVSTFFSFDLSAQQLKKKNLGVYSGTIPSYTMAAGEQVLDVSSTGIQIELKADKQVTETIGSVPTNGTYTVASETKTEIFITVNYPNAMVQEELVLNRKTHELERKGFYPQPGCILKKQ